MESQNGNAFTVEARYVEQRIPRFKGNPLISALSLPCGDEILSEQLTDLPDFDPPQRDWPTHDRILMVESLSAFKLPFERDIQTARAFDALIRNGYVGRAPRSVAHTKVFQKLYEAQQRREAFTMTTLLPMESQLSSAIIGISGTGKTTTIQRIFSRYPESIYHPEYNITQIPYVHIQAPHDGISPKGLAMSILRKIDRLVPSGRYYEIYLRRTNQSVETLLNHCARVMHMHFVGVLVVDEIQNLKNPGTSQNTLMSLLVSASNELGVPIVFVGTSQAIKILSLDFRQGRRSVGHGFPAWGTLVRSGSLKDPGEWEIFATCLWRFQWNRVVVPFSDEWSELFYEYSQGIADIAIKLFVCAQWRAMIDGTETFSMQTFGTIMESELNLIEPMLDAMRRGDDQALDQYHDLRAPSYESLREETLKAYAGIRQRGAETRPGDASFVPRVTTTLMEAGIEENRALSLAKTVELEGKVTGIIAGVAAALKLAQPVKSPRRSDTASTNVQSNLASDDYRNALQNAATHGGTVFSHLEAMGAVCELDRLLGLN